MIPPTFDDWFRENGHKFNDPSNAKYAAHDAWVCGQVNGVITQAQLTQNLLKSLQPHPIENTQQTSNKV